MYDYRSSTGGIKITFFDAATYVIHDWAITHSYRYLAMHNDHSFPCRLITK